MSEFLKVSFDTFQKFPAEVSNIVPPCLDMLSYSSEVGISLSSFGVKH